MTIGQIANISFLLGHRVKSLAEDGYFVVLKSKSMQGEFIKMKHRKNGNEITISADIRKNHMIQKSNGNIVYEGEITG